MKQKAALIYERQETVVLRQSGSHRQDFCERCGDERLFVTPEILATVTDASERELFRLVEAGLICFVETNRLYVCPECYQSALGEDGSAERQFGARGELQ